MGSNNAAAGLDKEQIFGMAEKEMEYRVDLFNRHPFDSSKWGRICRFLITKGILDKNSIVEPIEASQNDLLVVL